MNLKFQLRNRQQPTLSTVQGKNDLLVASAQGLIFLLSETDMDSSDHEARLKALQGQCQEKEKIVAKLRRTLKKHAGSRKYCDIIEGL